MSSDRVNPPRSALETEFAVPCHPDEDEALDTPTTFPELVLLRSNGDPVIEPALWVASALPSTGDIRLLRQHGFLTDYAVTERGIFHRLLISRPAAEALLVEKSSDSHIVAFEAIPSQGAVLYAITPVQRRRSLQLPLRLWLSPCPDAVLEGLRSYPPLSALCRGKLRPQVH